MPNVAAFCGCWVTRQLLMIRKQETVEKYLYFITKIPVGGEMFKLNYSDSSIEPQNILYQ